MGSAISRLNDDFVELTEKNYPTHDHLVLVDIGDILDAMHTRILSDGETPAYENLQYGNIGAFLFDLYHEVGYLPGGSRSATDNIRDVLDAAPQYFDCTSLSSLQRQCWHVAMQKMVERFVEFKMYDHTHIHRFDFYDYQYGTLYLRQP